MALTRKELLPDTTPKLHPQAVPAEASRMPGRIYSKGIVFDFDGVLVDSEMHWAEVETPYLKQHIPAWRTEDYSQLIGKSLPEVFELLVSQYAFGLSQQDYFDDYEEMAKLLYSKKATALPGIREVLDHLATQNIKVAIASSSKRAWIDAALQANGLTTYFDVIVSAHDKEIDKGKPAPDVYLRAATLLDESPSDLIAIEDSRNGVRSAKAAALFCFGLRNGMNEDQELGEADEVIHGYDTFLVKIQEVMK